MSFVPEESLHRCGKTLLSIQIEGDMVHLSLFSRKSEERWTVKGEEISHWRAGDG